MKRIIALFILICMTLTLCACGGNDPSETPDTPAEPDDFTTPSESASAMPAAQKDGKFTLLYEEDAGFNPITGESVLNMQIAALLYEGLFKVDQNFNAVPVLCESYNTEDGITWTFKIVGGVMMSDGEVMDAKDVVYSLNQATLHRKFSSRLACIDTIGVTDEHTFYITLEYANYSLPTLLDVPIIRYGSLYEDVPAGTGPFRYLETPVPCLLPVRNYREELPVRVIYLTQLGRSLLPEAFSAHEIDMITLDPLTETTLYLRNDHEIRSSATSILEYVGFNCTSYGLDNANIRKAISMCIDRAAIYSDIIGDDADPSPTLINPACSYYDESVESLLEYNMLGASQLFLQSGMADPDNDGFLEYYITPVTYANLDLRLVVCNETPYKVEIAKKIATSLRNMGLSVNVLEYDWDNFRYALNTGEFDMYIASASVPANYDFTEFLLPGGKLNYGSVNSDSYSLLISEFLAASDADAKRAASGKLCTFAANDASIIPLAYRVREVHTNRGVITGLTPTEAQPLYDFADLEINP